MWRKRDFLRRPSRMQGRHTIWQTIWATLVSVADRLRSEKAQP